MSHYLDDDEYSWFCDYCDCENDYDYEFCYACGRYMYDDEDEEC